MQVEVAIPTWNRRELVTQAVDSALAQEGVPNLQVVVYDNGSTDGTADHVRARYGDFVRLERWDTNQGATRNISRGLVESEADAVLVLADDEVLLPGALASLVEALAADPSLAFVTGLQQLRTEDGTVLSQGTIVPEVRPPAVQEGLDFIRLFYAAGDYAWICSTLFRLERVRPASQTDSDKPYQDVGLFLRAALKGRVGHVDVVVATHTEGNVGVSLADGMVDVVGTQNVMTVPACAALRRVYERFLLEEGHDAFSRRERGRLLARCDRLSAGLMGMTIGGLAAHQGWRAELAHLREALFWIRRPRSRFRLLRNAALAWQEERGRLRRAGR